MKIEMTQLQAEKLGIVFCKCGHPPNNHFDFLRGGKEVKHCRGCCAHCACPKYQQEIRLPNNVKAQDT